MAVMRRDLQAPLRAAVSRCGVNGILPRIPKGTWLRCDHPLGEAGCDRQHPRYPRKLVIIDSEAEIVRLIFRRYAELGSVRLLKDEFEARRIDSRSWTSASGRLVGGKPFSRGALYLILQNRIPRGSGSPEIKLHRRGR